MSAVTTSHITFTNSLDDYLAFGEHHYRVSPVIKRSRLITQGIPLLLFFYFLGLYLFGSQSPSMFFWMFLAIAFLVFTRLYHKRNYIKRLTRMYQEGVLLNTDDPIVLDITEGGLDVRAGSRSGLIGWNEIERVDIIPLYTFIYTGPVIALIIPKEKVLEGSYGTFIDELKRLFSSGRTAGRGN
jgi:hypothetical protein